MTEDAYSLYWSPEDFAEPEIVALRKENERLRNVLQWIALGPYYDYSAEETVLSMMEEAANALAHP